MGSKKNKQKNVNKPPLDVKKERRPFDYRVLVILAAALIIFVAGCYFGAQPFALYNSDQSDANSAYFAQLDLSLDANRALFEGADLDADYSYAGEDSQLYEYEYAVVTAVTAESLFEDENTQNVHIGSQALEILIKTGQYKGQTMTVTNYMSKLFDKHCKEGTGLLVNIYTNYGRIDETTGETYVSVSITNYNRIFALVAALAIFAALTVLIGGRVGLRSILGLAFTIACVFLILIPLLIRGASAIWLTVAIAVYCAVVCFVLLDGISAKTVAAVCGTVLGFVLAALFSKMVGSFVHLDGLLNSTNETDSLIQAKYQGYPIDIRGLFTAGIIIAALGAVMDVAMSIASSVTELWRVNPDMKSAQLFRSGMNIGRDSIGTMTNTLILAFTGSALVDFLLITINDWDIKAVLNNDFMVSELISGLSGSIGIILAVPATALIASLLAPHASVFELKPKPLKSKDGKNSAKLHTEGKLRA